MEQTSMKVIILKDKEMRVCMDPRGNGATMNKRGEREPGPPGISS
jgi:hypothetical protein